MIDIDLAAHRAIALIRNEPVQARSAARSPPCSTPPRGDRRDRLRAAHHRDGRRTRRRLDRHRLPLLPRPHRGAAEPRGAQRRARDHRVLAELRSEQHSDWDAASVPPSTVRRRVPHRARLRLAPLRRRARPAPRPRSPRTRWSPTRMFRALVERFGLDDPTSARRRRGRDRSRPTRCRARVRARPDAARGCSSSRGAGDPRAAGGILR